MSERTPVAQEEWLFRRCYLPQKKYFDPNGNPTSRIFKLRPKDNGELSVDVKSMSTSEKSIKDSAKFFLFELPYAGVLDIEGLNTLHDPLPNQANDAHAVIIGCSEEDEIKPNQLAKIAKLV